MRLKILKLLLTFTILFSLSGFSQATDDSTDKSKHPLLDKYYPRAEKTDPEPIATNKPAPVISQPAETKPLAAKPITSLPVSGTRVISQTTPAIAVTDTVNVTSPETTVPQPQTQLATETIPLAIATDTATVSRPITTAVTVPVQKQVQPRPPSTPYIDTRLGSSTPAYDTWKKNSNGAGSVTTSPK